MSDLPSLDPPLSCFLTAERIDYLHFVVSPISPFLNDCQLLDRTLTSWVRRELILESIADQSLDLSYSELTNDQQKKYLRAWSSKYWDNRIESLFLSNKSKLDRLGCSIIKLKCQFQAIEFYHRIKANEQSFEELAARHSFGDERFSGGRCSVQPLSSFPIHLQTAFRSMKVGDLLKPVKYGENNYAILRLDAWEPASLNSDTVDLLFEWELTDWQHSLIPHLRQHLVSLNTGV